MKRIETDICVIGAGSGGLSVAAGAVQMGARVVLIEADEMGGDCLNTGCVPSKALIAAAKVAEAQRRGFRGVASVTPQVDFAAVKDHVQAVIDEIAPVDSQDRFEGLGCTVIRAFARFTAPREVQAGETTVRARRFVIATGSRAMVPPIQGIETVPYLTNETIFGLRERPEHLIVIGGGPIGVEMAQAHRRLGCEVTVIEGARVLGREDPELAAEVIEALLAEGITLVEGQPVVRLSGIAGAVEVTLGDGRQIKGSHLLMAVGRKVALDGMNLEAAGVAYTSKGVTVDARLRSSNRRVYAVGDVAGGLQFTHVAAWHAGIVIRQAVLGLPAKVDPRALSRATYTDPELAQAGLTEAEARKLHGEKVTVVRAEFAHNDRALAEGKGKGLLKVMVVKGRPVGASIVGPQAGELIGLWALAISSRLKMSAIAGMVAPYPTLGEVSKRAAGAYFSPKLFENPTLKRLVRVVQRWVP
ncbi:NAD(P)/FAD-dependent oxidoreductase [Tabrizicola sp.]|uniref:dihydrolipoyl dehydrogenase family protein n=1 Tax=Tabrizicola sp. TaxID=2005166 RepID=UPI00273549BD|nr:FAD-dependent oxidoreductase [Tabrizicola sp.]MDP3195264.1 FAD-dependent oxidoreductase [Tabrizicola sp.]